MAHFDKDDNFVDFNLPDALKPVVADSVASPTGGINTIGDPASPIIIEPQGLAVSPQGYIRSGQPKFNVGNGFFLGGDGVKTKFSVGNSTGNYLAWDGIILRLYGLMQFGRAYFVGNYNDGLTKDIGGLATVSRALLDTLLNSTAGATDTSMIYSILSGVLSPGVSNWKQNIQYSIAVYGGGFPRTGADVRAFTGICDFPSGTIETGAPIITSTTMTSLHIGFYFVDANGAYPTVWATCANGTAQTLTAIGTMTHPTVGVNTYNIFRFEKAGPVIKYYFDDALVATHSTNVPDTNSTYSLCMKMGNNASAKAASFIFTNNYQLLVQ